jgi:hypothetical protein
MDDGTGTTFDPAAVREGVFVHRGTIDGGTVIVNQSNRRPGACMGDKSPKSKDRQKKQDAKEKSQKVAIAAQKVAAKQAPLKTGK